VPPLVPLACGEPPWALGEVAVLGTAMADRPKRRWLRFSLRTMLVMFTVVAVWLGWNARLVHQRQKLLHSLPAQHIASDFVSDKERLWPTRETEYFTDDALTRRDPAMRARHRRYEPTAPYRLSRVRKWLGDELRIFIAYHPGPNLERTRHLFPEAIVYIYDEPWDDPSDW